MTNDYEAGLTQARLMVLYRYDPTRGHFSGLAMKSPQGGSGPNGIEFARLA